MIRTRRFKRSRRATAGKRFSRSQRATIGAAPIITYAETNDVSSPEEQNGDFPGGLKDVDTENPAVQAAMIQAYSRWVELTDLDGFRIDTLKHVPHAFWQIFAPAVRERLTGRGQDATS